jgi:hypothetical protein
LKTNALVKKVNQATLEQQHLIAQILDAPESFQECLSETLSQIKKKKATMPFLQAIVDVGVEVSKEVSISPDLSKKTPFERIVDVLTTKEALSTLAPCDPLAAARLKGVMIKSELLYEDGQPLTSEQVGSLLGITRQAVDKRRKKGQLLGITLGRRGYLYPVWQFAQGQVLPGLEPVLKELSEYDPWTQLMFFKTGDLRLDGDTPLQRLKAGDIEQVVLAASCYGEQLAS